MAWLLLPIWLPACASVLHYNILAEPLPLPGGTPAGPEEWDQAWRDADRNPDRLVRAVLGRLAADPDPEMVELAWALSRLPDLNPAPAPAAARGLRRLFDLITRVGPEGRQALGSLARDNRASDQFGAGLQGLLWLAEKGNLNPSLLNNVRPGFFVDLAWEMLFERLRTPQDILSYLSTNYSYRLNPVTAQSRREFFASKYGDCTEFALLAGHLLHGLGFEVWVLLSKPTKISGHASIIYADAQGLWLLDSSRVALNGILRRKMAAGPLNHVDRLVWAEMRGFDRVFGPAKNVADLVRIYEKEGRPVRFRIIPYAEYSFFIEEHGREDWEWWQF